MAKYRTIDLRLWSDRRFLSLSDEAKLLWIFYLTSPSTIAIPGVIIGGEATLAEQLGWSLERYRIGYREVVAKGLRVRCEGRLVWLSNALKYQPPTGPKVIIGWSKCWDDIPEGDLKRQIFEALKIACKRWDRVFKARFPDPYGIGYAQPYLELFPPGTGSGTRTGSETGSGSGEREQTALPIAKPVEFGGSWKRRMSWWNAMRDAHDRLRNEHEIKRNTPDLPKSFGGENERNLAACERGLRESGYNDDEIDLKFRHVIAVAEAEAIRVQHLDWFIPAMIFDPKRFNRAVDTPIEVAARGSARSGRARGALAIINEPDDEPEMQGVTA